MTPLTETRPTHRSPEDRWTVWLVAVGALTGWLLPFPAILFRTTKVFGADQRLRWGVELLGLSVLTDISPRTAHLWEVGLTVACVLLGTGVGLVLGRSCRSLFRSRMDGPNP